tara:strand:- start:1282 stop:1521 length:240 start_codon:yes stop_codon:yes gene_type:complete
MPNPHLTNEVANAVQTLQDFIDNQNKSKRSAAQTRGTDWSGDEPKDRIRYYDTNIEALRNVLAGHGVLSGQGWLEGLRF